jgi:hypothetical protein
MENFVAIGFLLLQVLVFAAIMSGISNVLRDKFSLKMRSTRYAVIMSIIGLLILYADSMVRYDMTSFFAALQAGAMSEVFGLFLSALLIGSFFTLATSYLPKSFVEGRQNRLLSQLEGEKGKEE